MFLRDTLDKSGQVTLQVQAGSEEVGDDDDALHETSDQQICGFFQTGTAEFQEGGFDDRVVARACEVGGGHTDGLVRAAPPGSEACAIPLQRKLRPTRKRTAPPACLSGI